MALTTAQLTTLKAAIVANPTWNALPVTVASSVIIAAGLNAQASPSFTVWKSSVSITDTGKQFVGTEWASMTSANHTRLQTVAQWLAGGYSPALADIRAMFDDIWSGAGGALTRAKYLAFWKRLATAGEKIFATGTGSDASPATMVVEGAISVDDVQQARELP